MKKLITTTLSLFFCGLISGQNNANIQNQIDSLNQIFVEAQHDTTRALVYYEIADLYFKVDKDSAKSLARVAYEMATRGVESDQPLVRDNYENLLGHVNEYLGILSTHTGAFEEAVTYYEDCMEIKTRRKDRSGACECLTFRASAYAKLGEIEKAEEGYLEAMEVYTELGDQKGLAQSKNDYAYLHLDLGNNAKAIKYFEEAIAIRKEIDDQEGLTSSYNNIAIVYYNLGDYTKALDLWYKSMKISETNDHKIRVAQCLNNIAGVYYELENWEKCFSTFHRALAIHKEVGDIYSIANCYNNLSVVHGTKDEFLVANAYLDSALEGFEKLDFKKAIAYAMINKARNCLDMDSVSQARTYLAQAVNLSREIENKDHLCNAYYVEGEIEFKAERFGRALAAANKSMELAEELDYDSRRQMAARLLFKVHKARREWQASLGFYEQYIALRDSSQNFDIERAALAKEAQFELEKAQQLARFNEEKQLQDIALKEEKIARLQKEKQFDQLALLSTIGGVLMILGIAILWFRGYQQRMKARELQAEKQIKAYLGEINTLQTSMHAKLVGTTTVDAELINANMNELFKTSLTEREKDVLIELSKGKENKEIAETLFISVNTVRTHLLKIYDKMEVKNRTQAVKKAQSLNRIPGQ